MKKIRLIAIGLIIGFCTVRASSEVYQYLIVHGPSYFSGNMTITGNLFSNGKVQIGNGASIGSFGATCIGDNNVCGAHGVSIIGGSDNSANNNNDTIVGSYLSKGGGGFTTIVGGQHNTGDVAYCTIVGSNSQCKGQWNTLVGYGLVGNDSWTTAVGKFNVGYSDSLFEIGLGTATNARANAMTIYSTGNAEFTQNTTWVGSGIVWNDIQNLQLWDTDAVGEKPTLTPISGSAIKTRCFDDNDAMYGSVEIPHDMFNETGSIWSPHIHWMGNADGATTGIRNFEYTILKANGSYLTSSIISTSIYNITGWDSRIDDLDGDFSATGLALGDTMSFKVYRTTADTYAGNMCLLQVGIHYQTDRRGSRDEYIK